MAEANNGRLIREIVVSHGESSIRPETGEVFVFEYEYHGDHAAEWVVRRTIGARKETARWNAAQLAFIEWSD